MKFFRHPLWIYLALLALLAFANIEYQSAHADTFTLPTNACYSKETLHWKTDPVNLRVFVTTLCRRPLGFHRSLRIYRPLKWVINDAEISSDVSEATAARLDAKYTTRALTPTELDAVTRWADQYLPVVTVAPNGTTKTRPVYSATAAHTKGVVTTKKVATGLACDIGDSLQELVDGTYRQTDYFAVPGGYALCVVK